MPAINSFRFTVTLVLVVVFCMYNYRTSDPGLERTRLRRAAITKWPGTTYPLPISHEWSKLVDLSAVPDLKVRATNSEACASPDLGCTWSCNGCMAADDIKTCPDRNTLALSFDDGPSPATPGLLDMLDKDNIKVTFFVVGTQLLSDTNKATLLRAFKAGHQIASHTWSHRALTTLSNQEIIAEVMWSHEIIKSVIGVAPVYIRPPYGDVDNRVRSILKQLGYHIAIWSHDTFDWQIASDPTKTAESVAADFKTWINDQSRSLGMITLEHDLYDAAVAAVPGSLAVIKESKINLMTIAKCVGRNAYVESVNETVSGSSDTPKSTPASKISSTSSTPKSADTSAASSTASVLSMGYFFVASLLFIVAAF